MKKMNEEDFRFLEKYNKPGPRYTSYPTAPMFSENFTADDFISEIIETNKDENASPISLYFHFLFCAKLCYFCGCNMRITSDRNLIARYNDYLKREVLLIKKFLSKKRKVAQMHWGGGTPSYLLPDEIKDFGEFIRANFEFSADAEIGVEIDPRGLTKEHMEAFRSVGFNRISMGVQDFDPKVQRAINRIQTEEITKRAIDWARQLGFESVNIDLIYGLPHQTLESFSITVDKTIQMSPDRVAVFNYAHVPWLKKHQKLIKAEDLPKAEEKLKILKMTIEKMTSAGYEYIGMDHFAKSTDELAIAQKNNSLHRNFQGYSTKAGCDVYAFGVSAISQFENIYAQNTKDLKEYFERIGAGRPATKVGYRMSADDRIRKETIMQLMCHLKIDKRKIEQKFGIRFDEYFADSITQLETFIADGLVENKKDEIRVKEYGKFVIRNIAMCFDAYLQKIMAEKPIFSKTV
ncbi:MAG: oxygen-independent coproporphyrinogen III oxidase [Acidobacteria bacterium]|jgi:oxygen-independent coproporphyrinogen-3 oxidase|nr:MAG: oxygen-independent coproporphyrinogen III oxidase [Acidobacteriota bacterium]GIU81266.1 MAG: coproporphyrinogen-III oxidase [Pyrinomonadaceae bacterium]